MATDPWFSDDDLTRLGYALDRDTIKPPVLPAEPQVFTFGGGGPVVHATIAHVVPSAPRWPPPDGPLCPCTNADPAACAGRHEEHPVQPAGAPCACICHVMGEA